VWLGTGAAAPGPPAARARRAHARLAHCAQQIDVLGLTTGVFNALACPIAAGGAISGSFSLDIPDEAAGLGDLQIILNATNQDGQVAMCLNISVTL
jgi:hypothetical protein